MKPDQSPFFYCVFCSKGNVCFKMRNMWILNSVFYIRRCGWYCGFKSSPLVRTASQKALWTIYFECFKATCFFYKVLFQHLHLILCNIRI
uniref:Uncharacterized protein n=1 Tax=Anguilla anguilla TaxID=7936 RepID=A0A0E9X668_ANGAN